MTTLKAALVGNPNCGKTTLFNALTGAHQHVGNWPGVTVERKSGELRLGDAVVELIDLPGIYALTNHNDAIDEHIACDFIARREADVLINIVDASHLERHLYLTLQLLETGVPVILALNMADIARAERIQIDVEGLERELGCPVVLLEAHQGKGLDELKAVIANRRHCEERFLRRSKPGCDVAVKVETWFASSQKAFLAMTAADSPTERYNHIDTLIQQYIQKPTTKKITWTERFDNIVLNRFLGIPIFLGVMYLLFYFSINVGGALQTYFDAGSEMIFVQGIANVLTQFHAPNALIALLANGVGKGLNTTITFIPVIGALFLFLAFLEDSGYMTRAAFVVDRLMRALGLPGKAFVPMIVGFGCNVPAVMAARTLENKRDRIITILMSPFMSCGARLAIYAVFTAAFFPQGGQNIVFALYLIGIFMAIFTGFILRKTLLKGKPAPLIMELPAYHVPRIKSLLLHAWQRLKGFVLRAGKLIVLISVIIGVLNTLNIDGTLASAEGNAQSLLSAIGKSMTFVFTPMGVHTDNWPATVGLLTGVLAKEVVVGTLNTLYAQMSHLPAYGVMIQQFDGKIGAFAYLLFVLLYFPCVSTLAAMLREMHRGWVFFSAYWSIGVAYAMAVMFYQIATCMQHPLSSCLWVTTMLSFFFGTIIVMRWYASRSRMVMVTVASQPCGQKPQCLSRCANCPFARSD